MDGVGGGLAGNIIFDGVAGGVAVSRVAAEFSGEGFEERVCGVVDGVDAVRAFAYYEFGIPELAVCNSGGDCGALLWVDLEEDRIDFCFGAGACGGGCYLAFFVSDDVRRGKEEVDSQQLTVESREGEKQRTQSEWACCGA